MRACVSARNTTIRVAATLASSCTDTSCSVSLQVLDKDLAEGLDLLMQALTQPAFAQERLDLAKKSARQALERRNDAVTSIAHSTSAVPSATCECQPRSRPSTR